MIVQYGSMSQKERCARPISQKPSETFTKKSTCASHTGAFIASAHALGSSDSAFARHVTVARTHAADGRQSPHTSGGELNHELSVDVGSTSQRLYR